MPSGASGTGGAGRARPGQGAKRPSLRLDRRAGRLLIGAAMGQGLARIKGGHAVLALVLMTLLCRALVPAGYMVETTNQGVRIEICTSRGLSDRVIDPAMGAMGLAGDAADGSEDGAGREASPCVFAATPPLAEPVAFALGTWASYASPAPASAQARAQLFDRGLFAPPPWATGPPLHV